jgi:hypothetical protein
VATAADFDGADAGASDREEFLAGSGLIPARDALQNVR